MATILTRRSILGHSAVALIGGAGLAFAVPNMDAGATAVHDPMLDLIERYRAGMALYDYLDIETDESAEATFLPLCRELCDNPPAITTEAGAFAALKLVAEQMEHSEGGFIMPLIHTVITYFENRLT